MGKNSRIEWTNHTFNPWWGCTKVSAACKHCYAEAWAKRVGQSVWGPNANRRFFGDTHWAEPIKWHGEALAAGQRRRVFCASMADVFEDRRDLDAWRAKLWALIDATPQLDWLLLTKRPEMVGRLVPWGVHWPHNIWLGTTVEHQEAAESRLMYLATLPAVIRFISAEPLLGSLDLTPWLGTTINWVITGGESGPNARPSSPSWFRSILHQCRDVAVPFHFKQWGDWMPSTGDNAPAMPTKKARTAADSTLMFRVGKKAAGRLLDGTTWDGLPEVTIA